MTGGDPTDEKSTSPQRVSLDESPVESSGNESRRVRGVMILGIRSDSEAWSAGLRKGDIIIQYDGTGDLTTEKLAQLSAGTRPGNSRIPVVYVREGHKESLNLSPGSLGIRGRDATTRIGPLSDSGTDSQPGKPLFVLKYRAYKVVLRTVWFSGVALMMAAMAFGGDTHRIHTVSAFVAFVLFKLVAVAALSLFFYWLFETLRFREVRIYADRIVKAWRWPGPVEREVHFATARYASMRMFLSSKVFFDEDTNKYLRHFKGIFYDESLVDYEEVDKLNRVLADLSGRSVKDFERFYASEEKFIKDQRR